MLLTYDNVRLPEEVEIEARVILSGSTLVSPGFGDTETRLARRLPRRRYVVKYGPEYVDDVEEMFYTQIAGRYGFTFRDPKDNALADELIGTGDGADTTFSIIKGYYSYSPAAVLVRSAARRILSVDVATLVVTVNGGVTSAYTLDTLGVLTFISPPANGHAVRVTCDYFVVVRFDDDNLEMTLHNTDVHSVQQCNLIELLP